MEEMKVCGKCGEEKTRTTEYFGREKGNRDGLKGTCKACISMYDKVKNTKEYKDSVVVKKAEFLLSDTKQCSDCKETFPKTSEYFPPRTDSEDGLRGQCRKCKSIKDDIYNEENKEHIANRHRQYHKENKETIDKYQAQWHLDNKESLSVWQKEYQFINKDRIAIYQKTYHIVNKESIAVTTMLYRNKPGNKEINSAYQRIYHKKNIEKFRIWGQNRRSRMRKLRYSLTVEQWFDIKSHFDNKCAFCGDEAPLTHEHFVAVTKDGEYTKDNIIPSCMRCNRSKHNSNPIIWYQKQPFYTKDKEAKILKHLGYKNNRQQLSIF